MSGLTTTGATVIVGLDDAPQGILLWRALLQWLGGIGIIGVAIAILPALGVGGMQLFRTESSDRSEKVMPRVREIATGIVLIYVGLTVAVRACLLAGGDDAVRGARPCTHDGLNGRVLHLRHLDGALGQCRPALDRNPVHALGGDPVRALPTPVPGAARRSARQPSLVSRGPARGRDRRRRGMADTCGQAQRCRCAAACRFQCGLGGDHHRLRHGGLHAVGQPNDRPVLRPHVRGRLHWVHCRAG